MTKKQISREVSIFHERILPESKALLVGYSALIDAYDLKLPLPDKLALISHQHKRYDTESWAVYTPRYKPSDTLGGHLTFALRYEGVELGILHAIFVNTDEQEIEEWVKHEPLGQYSRRIWFFYEWLTGKKLNLPDIVTGNFVDALDSKQYYVGPSMPSKRHRVYNNCPGVLEFCPLVRRTAKLESYIARDLSSIAHQKTGTVHPDILTRAAAFLLLKDSRASFAIEGEYPKKERTERWGRAIGQAGLTSLSVEELIRLQKIVIGDTRFVNLGLRTEGGFIGMHDRSTGIPIPDHISARWEDLPTLMQGLIATDKLLKTSQLDPVIAAAMIAFGFVFIHPFSDGNGRIQRYLIHHVLAENKFTPKGVVFPVSAVILDRIGEYKQILESYSRPRLEYIDWHAQEDGNIKVLNNTIDLYSYFDATKQAEFLYDCVCQTIDKVLPEEMLYLQRYDQIRTAINERFDMPGYKADLLIRFLEQNKGKVSNRAKEKEFKALSEDEFTELERLYQVIFETTSY